MVFLHFDEQLEVINSPYARTLRASKEKFKRKDTKTQRHKEKIIERPGALCLCV